MLFQQRLDLGHGIDDAGNALVVVDGRDEVGGVLGNVHVEVPGTLQQFRLAVGQVGTQNRFQDTIVVSLVELIQAGGEQREGGAGKDVAVLREGADSARLPPSLPLPRKNSCQAQIPKTCHPRAWVKAANWALDPPRVPWALFTEQGVGLSQLGPHSFGFPWESDL